MYHFFAHHFKLNFDRVALPGGGVNEAGTVVEDRDSLRVFTAVNPRPAQALQGWQTVNAALQQAQAAAANH